MSFLKIARWLGGGLLLLCLVLPLSECERKQVVPDDGNGNLTVRNPGAPRTEVLYPINHMDFSKLGGYVVLAAYTWPILAALASIRAKKPVGRLVHSTAEALLCAGSGYLIYLLGAWGRRLIGGYLALVALSIYLLESLAEIWSVWHTSRASKAPNPGMEADTR